MVSASTVDASDACASSLPRNVEVEGNERRARSLVGAHWRCWEGRAKFQRLPCPALHLRSAFAFELRKFYADNDKRQRESGLDLPALFHFFPLVTTTSAERPFETLPFNRFGKEYQTLSATP
jgi:hypothetical protein